jgi:rhamnosyltransferase subunit B
LLAKNKHFLIAVSGSYGDFLSFFRIATCLKRRGYKVSFFSITYFEKYLHGTDIPFYPMEGDFFKLFSSGNRQGTLNKMLIEDFLYPNFNMLQMYISKRPNEAFVIISSDACRYMADIATEYSANSSAIHVHLSPHSYQTIDSFYKNDSRFKNLPFEMVKKISRIYSKQNNALLLEHLNKTRNVLKLPLIANLDNYHADDSIIRFALFPKWLVKKEEYQPKRIIFSDFLFCDIPGIGNITNNLEAFLSAEPQPILVTLGSIISGGLINSNSEKYLFELTKKIAKINDMRFIIISENLANENFDTKSIFITSKINLPEVLPRVKAIVHHGGIGTIAQALKFAVPQLMLPFGHDQFTNAGISDNLGVGAFINFSSLNIKNYKQGLEKIISDMHIKESCIKIASSFENSMSLDEIVDQIISSSK